MIRLLSALPLFIYSMLIIYLSNQPNIQLPDLGFNLQDKFLHLVAYFVYGSTIIIALLGNFPEMAKKKLIIFVITIGCIFAASDEIHQFYIPGRVASFWDWVADVLGVLFSLLTIKPISKRMKVKGKINIPKIFDKVN